VIKLHNTINSINYNNIVAAIIGTAVGITAPTFSRKNKEEQPKQLLK